MVLQLNNEDKAYLSMLGIPWRWPLSGCLAPPTLFAPTQAFTMSVLYLFSGISRKASMGEELARLCKNANCTLTLVEIDILNDPATGDLTKDEV